MEDYLSLWAARLASRSHRSLAFPVSVTGAIKQPRPPSMFAMVALSAIPHDRFEVVDATTRDATVARLGFPESFILGLLDVLMTDAEGPLAGLRITLTDVKYHDRDTSAEAFVLAGRDAGRQICRLSGSTPEPPGASTLRTGAILG